MSDKLGIIEIGIAVVISITASWIYVKEDLAQLNARVDQIEEENKENVEVTRQFSNTLHELNIVLAGMKVEMGYIKEGINSLKKDKEGAN